MGEDYPKASGGRRSFAAAALGEVEIFALARKIVEEKKRFLDPSLTMESLAGKLNVHRPLASLALMSGFSNRKSFHRVYTALRHSKPSETLPGRKNKSIGKTE